MNRNPDRTLIFPRGCAGTSDHRERKSHAVRRVRLDAEADSPGLGGTPTSDQQYPKGYCWSLLARVIGNFRNGISKV